MRKIAKASLFLFAITTFFNCAKDLYVIPNNLIVHDFVWKGLNAYYLDQDKIPNLSDRRFNSDQQLNAFLSTFSDHTLLFSSLLEANDTKSRIIQNYTAITPIPKRSASTNGVEFGIIADPENTGTGEFVIGYATHILPNSDASTKSIKRGEYFNTVSGIRLTKTNYQKMLITGTDTLTFGMVDFDGKKAVINNKKVFLEKKTYNYPSLFLEKTITEGVHKIGYLLYNNDFSENYIEDLNTSFLNLKNQAVNKLVLDFRYNIGGGSFVKNMNQIASMITGQFPNEIFLKEKWNTKAQAWFEANQPDSLVTRFTSKLNATTNINSLNLKEVYIVLNGTNFTGNSAIELLLNSLKPYINVCLVGTSTAGNNTGFITLYNSDDYDFIGRNETHTVALQPQVLSFLNKNDETFANGFNADISICPNENVLNLGVLGDKNEPILNFIITHISTGSAVITSPCNPLTFEYIFNSITSQIEVDNGVFITRDLPNTYINKN